MADLPITYVTLESLPSKDLLEKFSDCANKVAINSTLNQWEQKLSDRALIIINYATVGDQIIGFVAGYELKPKLFYNWRGGVQNEYLKQGVDAKLMQAQIGTCKKHGFDLIKTKTNVKLKDMIICNLRAGFDICATNIDENHKTRLVMEKKLQ